MRVLIQSSRALGELWSAKAPVEQTSICLRTHRPSADRSISYRRRPEPGRYVHRTNTGAREAEQRPSGRTSTDHLTGPASGATNCRTDSNQRIAAAESARPIHCPGKFYSSRRRDTGFQLGYA
jgi:hypothetical protein